MRQPAEGISDSQLILGIREKDFAVHTHVFRAFLPEESAIYLL